MTKPFKKRADEGSLRTDTIAFLTRIGIEIVQADFEPGFLKTCRIVDGALHVSPNTPIGDILHESGHLATVPTRYRHLLQDNVDHVIENIFELPEVQALMGDPDHPLLRALLQCSDSEATAWAWAAGLAIGLPDRLIIEDIDYDNGGAVVRFLLLANQYIGIHGLVHAGFCVFPKNGGYPNLLKWLQDADFDTPRNLTRQNILASSMSILKL